MAELSNKNVPLVTSDLRTPDGNLSFDGARKQAAQYLPKPGSERMPMRQAACGEVGSDLSSSAFSQPLRLVGGGNASSGNAITSGPLASVDGIGGVSGGSYFRPRDDTPFRVTPVTGPARSKINYKSPQEYVGDVLDAQRRAAANRGQQGAQEQPTDQNKQETPEQQARKWLQSVAGSPSVDHVTHADIHLLAQVAIQVGTIPSQERAGSPKHVVAHLAAAIAAYRNAETGTRNDIMWDGTMCGVLHELHRLGRDPTTGAESWTIKFEIAKTSEPSAYRDSFEWSGMSNHSLGQRTEAILTAANGSSQQWQGESGYSSDTIIGTIVVPKEPTVMDAIRDAWNRLTGGGR